MVEPGRPNAVRRGLMVPRVCELHAAGKTRVIRETRSFADVNEAIADVEAGKVPARIVFTPKPDSK